MTDPRRNQGTTGPLPRPLRSSSNNAAPTGAISLLAALLGLFLFSFAGWAQLTSGDIAGLVTDPTGAAVPGATVEVTNEGTGVKASQTTSGGGEYRFGNLPVGLYDLTVSAKGFSASSVKGVVVDLNRITAQNVALQVGQTATTVEVTESTTAIDTNTS